MIDSPAAVSTPLTEPPAIGAEVVVHGVTMTVRSVTGPRIDLKPPAELAAKGVGITTMRWDSLHQGDSGPPATPIRTVHDCTTLGVVPMAADDPRWARIRKNAIDPTSRQTAGLLEHLTELYQAEG